MSRATARGPPSIIGRPCHPKHRRARLAAAPPNAPMNHNPYQAPVEDQPVPSGVAGIGGIHSYVDQSSRAGVLDILLIDAMGSGVIAFISNYLQLNLLGRARSGLVGFEEADANDARQGLIAIVEIVLYIITVVVFGMFVHRANNNARALAPHQYMEFTPGWMVGWFFVPFANLWKPYQAVKETWAVSQSVVPGVVGLWWATWIASNIAGQIALRAGDDTIPGLLSATKAAMFSDVVGIVSAVGALLMVRGLHAVQQQHHQLGHEVPPA